MPGAGWLNVGDGLGGPLGPHLGEVDGPLEIVSLMLITGETGYWQFPTQKGIWSGHRPLSPFHLVHFLHLPPPGRGKLGRGREGGSLLM